MTLDDRLAMVESLGNAHPRIKEAILSDLNTIIGEDEPYPPELFKRTDADMPKYFRNKLRQGLRDKVKEYCK